MVTRKKLIETAANVIKSKKVKGGLIGDVGYALETVSGNVYTGVCADVGSNNFCAETIAIGSMITNKEFTIKRIVAV
jgi:cytidine deaminase